MMIASQALSISEGHDGKVLMSCHRGCEFNEILSALGVTYQQINPSEPFEVDRVQRARDFWDNAGDGVKHHPYAYKKLITEDFGARRGRGFGRVVGNGSDCIVVPMRSIEGDLVGVELINEDGAKADVRPQGLSDLSAIQRRPNSFTLLRAGRLCGLARSYAPKILLG